MRSASSELAAELERADSSVWLDDLRHDWSLVIADHVRDPNPELSPGDRVRAADRDNIGIVVSVAEDRAVVHFVSPEGNEATREFDVTELELLAVGAPDWVSDPDTVREMAATTNDPYLGSLASHLVEIDDARRHKGVQLVDEQREAGWMADVPDEIAPEVAYYRDRYQITSDDPLGERPPAAQRQKPAEWQRLAGRMGEPNVAVPASSRGEARVAGGRSLAATPVGVGEDLPPSWAQPLVGGQWSSTPTIRRRQEAVVAAAADYRDRYQITSSAGIGPRPKDPAQARAWHRIGNAAASLRPRDLETRQADVERYRGRERQAPHRKLTHYDFMTVPRRFGHLCGRQYSSVQGCLTSSAVSSA